MRYRIDNYLVSMDNNAIFLTVSLPAVLCQKLIDMGGSAILTGDVLKYVNDSVRVIADETRGGYIMMSTGQKQTLYSAAIAGNLKEMIMQFPKAGLIAAADGDADDIAAINAIAATDQFTIEFDWGESPEDMKPNIPTDYAKEAAATANKQTILDKIGDCVIFDYADSGLPAETGSGFCAYLDDGDFCIEDMDCHGEHAAQYKVGDIIHPTSDGDQTIDLVVAKSVSSTPSDIRLDEYIMYGVTDTILWKKGGYYRVTGIYDVYDSDGYEKLETQLITYEELDPDTVTGLLMQAVQRIIQGNQGDPALRQFFGLPESLPEYHAMTEAEVLEIADEEWQAMYGFVAVPNTVHTVDGGGSERVFTTYMNPSKTYADYGWPALWDAQGETIALTDHPTAGRVIYTFNPSNND